LGDQSDNVPGLQEWSPGFGRKTALKLIKKHGSLESLLLASKTRTVGRPYIQDALAKYRDALQRNLQVLSFRRYYYCFLFLFVLLFAQIRAL
jgi:5'-3' exonuclease